MSQHHDDRAGGAPHDGRGGDRRAPVRWVDVSAAPAPTGGDDRDVARDVASDVDRRIGALFAKVPAPAAFDDAARARVAARLQPSGQGQGGLGRVWSRPRVALGVAFGAVVLLLSGAVIAGGGVRVWWKRLRPDRAPAPVASSESLTRSRQKVPARGSGAGSDTDGNDDRAAGDGAQTTPSPAPAAAPDSAPEPNAATQVAAAAPPPRATPRPRRRQLASRQSRTAGPLAGTPAGPHTDGQAEAPLAAPAPLHDTGAPSATSVEPASAPLPSSSSSWMPAPDPAPRPARGAPTTALALAPTPPSQLSQEARLLNVAMVQLRQRRDGAAALATLNDYLARYPRGMLAGEARGARIDALLLLQRKNEALRALDATSLEPVGRGQELLVIRGELRARRACGDAIRDFDLVLGGAAPAPLEERALFGRAVCRQRQGDEQGARTDAAAYLARFPAGRFAPSVRHLVDGGRPAR